MRRGTALTDATLEESVYSYVGAVRSGKGKEAQEPHGNISSWDTSKVKDMTEACAVQYFAHDIDAWDVALVTRMDLAFEDASSFNKPLHSWRTSRVTSMEALFSRARSFNQNINAWDVGQVTTMHQMFHASTTGDGFNQDVGAWNVARVANFNQMFLGAKVFNRNIGKWRTSSATSMQRMFEKADAFDQDIGGWRTATVLYMGGMFGSATKFDQDLSAWDVGKVASWGKRGMFDFSALSKQNGDCMDGCPDAPSSPFSTRAGKSWPPPPAARRLRHTTGRGRSALCRAVYI